MGLFTKLCIGTIVVTTAYAADLHHSAGNWLKDRFPQAVRYVTRKTGKALINISEEKEKKPENNQPSPSLEEAVKESPQQQGTNPWPYVAGSLAAAGLASAGYIKYTRDRYERAKSGTNS